MSTLGLSPRIAIRSYLTLKLARNNTELVLSLRNATIPFLNPVLGSFYRQHHSHSITYDAPAPLEFRARGIDDATMTPHPRPTVKRPRKIILLRHGESEGNIDPSMLGYKPDYKLSLTDKGVQQAVEAGKQLRTHVTPDDRIVFYVSPYTRTRETYDNLIKSFEDVPADRKFRFEEPRLREVGSFWYDCEKSRGSASNFVDRGG